MLLNSNALISSTNLAWFDMRLLGENDNPLLLRGEEITSTWNGKRQGVQSVIMWRENQDPVDMLNFCATFGFSTRLLRTRNTRILEDWLAATPGSELGAFRSYWEALRFFDVNRARRFSAFDSRETISMSQPGSVVTAFARDGKLMALASFLIPQDSAAASWKERPVRRETLQVLEPEKLGLKTGTGYRIVDLLSGSYLDKRTYSLEELKKVPVELILGKARILLIQPAEENSHLVYFRGVDGVETEAGPDRLTFKITGTAGSPLSLYIDTRGLVYNPRTSGISLEKAKGDFAVFSGLVPEDKTVMLVKAQ